MIDSSLSSAGAKVVVASSSDENHPPENITDGSVCTICCKKKIDASCLIFFAMCLSLLTQKHEHVLDVHRNVSSRGHHSLRGLHARVRSDSRQL